MLELKKICKTYKSKKGSACAALKGINIKFPDSGMVFILGKSGSGKSTLLNVIGGLDAPDSGEIIIKGKSNKDFKPKDYDSYRNTYLGFIFQEYNVMDDFSVYDNVALALRLQGKKATKTEVAKILNKVDLRGLEKRKPSELSGGQKQRVAIARALVKEPEIIFGDEPTGNLDSKTSTQIFNLLQKLSKDKLVVIVSHDRDSAEKYADRIIELSDGNVIRDVVRKGDTSEFSIDGDTISIPANKPLKPIEIKKINEKIKQTNGNVKLKEVKKQYVDTGVVVNQKNDGFKLIKSRLPDRFAAHIGVSNFKKKKFRLVITIFLTVVALALFGLSQTLASYDLVSASASSFAKNNTKNIVLKQGEIDEEYGSFNYMIENTVTPETREKIAAVYDGELEDYYGLEMAFSAESSQILKMIRSMMGKTLTSIYTQETNGVIILNEQSLLKYFANEDGELEYLYGAYPTDAEKSTKVVITDYMADCLLNLEGAYATLYNKDATKILQYGMTDVYGNNVGVSGILYTGYKEKYKNIIESYKGGADTFTSHEDYDAFTNEVENYYTILFARDKALIDTYVNNSSLGYVARFKFKEAETTYPKSIYNSSYMMKGNMAYALAVQGGADISATFSGGAGFASAINANKNNIYLPVTTYNTMFGTELSVGNYGEFEQKQITMGVFSMLSKGETPLEEFNFTVIGVYSLDTPTSEYMSAIMSDEMVNDLNQENYSLKGLYLTVDGGEDTYKGILQKASDLNMYHVSEISDTLYMVSNIFEIFYIIFKWIALILGIFSAILLFNFVSLSVINKKKDIGILRAIGAKGTDVAKIFMIEALIVAAITVVFAWALMVLGIYGVNSLLSVNFKAFLQSNAIDKIALLQIAIVPFGAVILACLVVTVVATIIPTIRISKMKPVDAIKNAN